MCVSMCTDHKHITCVRTFMCIDHGIYYPCILSMSSDCTPSINFIVQIRKNKTYVYYVCIDYEDKSFSNVTGVYVFVFACGSLQLQNFVLKTRTLVEARRV